ncbi:MAG: nitrilase-related carbon-nitrogen hydrolase, partial [Arenicellales bacterium]|nr:nitrilase-related carbon-nitrogen hydrolase [Arenicellales bacterium]
MRAALIQTSASDDLQKNLEHTTSFLKEAAEQGAKLVCLQECFNTWFFPQRINPEDQTLAETLDG